MKQGTAWRNRIVGEGEEAPEQLLANPRNWRIHPKAQQDALAAVLTEVGWVQRVIVNRQTGFVVDGHARVALAISREEPSVPVIYVDLTEEEERVVMASLDPLAAMAVTDQEALDALLAEVTVADEALRAMLDGLRADGAKPGLTDPDAVPEPPPEPVSKLGDLWLCGDHRLLCGDATKAEDVERLLAEEKADCVFTSLPYGVGVDYGGDYEDTIENLRAMLPVCAELWRDIVVPGGFAVTNFGDVAPSNVASGADGPCEYPMALEYWAPFRAAGWVLWSRRVWCKPNPRVHSPWCIQSNRAATDWEHIWTWKAEGAAIVQRTDGNYRSANGWFDTSALAGVDVGKEIHGAGMPVSAAEWMISVHSRGAAAVLDPFLGSGTTMIACERLGRRCYGMEIEPRYVDVAVKRWEQFTGREAERG